MGRVIALSLHDHRTRSGWVVSNTPRPQFTPGKDPVPILQEAGWAPGTVWIAVKSRPHRYSIPDRPARSQSLYRLSYLVTHTHTYIYIYIYIYICRLILVCNESSSNQYKHLILVMTPMEGLTPRRSDWPPVVTWHWLWPWSLVFNLSKPTGYVMHQQFNIQQLYALPTLQLCVLYLSENKQRLVPLTA